MKRALLAATAIVCASSVFAQTQQPPPIAAAAGFTKEMLGGAIVLGLNWFVTPGANVTQNPDGSVTIAGADNYMWNGQLSTATSPTGEATMCNGTAFGGGGYFEATLSVKGKPAGWYSGANGWPSFWANAVESVYGSIVHNIEVDILELIPTDGSFGTGFHNWYENSNAVNTISIGQDGTAHTAGTDWSQPHKVGFLWIPGKGTQTLLDDRAVSSQALGPGTPFEQLDQQHLQLYLGSGKENPMTVYSVVVWQNPATADNVCQRGVSGTAGSGLIEQNTGGSGAAKSTNAKGSGAGSAAPTWQAQAPNGTSAASSNSVRQLEQIQSQIDAENVSISALESQLGIQQGNVRPDPSWHGQRGKQEDENDD